MNLSIKANDNYLFFEHYINDTQYFVGYSSFDTMRNNLYSKDSKLPYLLNNCDLGYEVNEKQEKMNLWTIIPYFSKGYVRCSLKLNIDAGIIVSPIIENDEYNYSLYETVSIYIDKDFRNTERYKTFHLFVLFKPEDIIFYDGRLVSVKKLYIPDKSLFGEIIDKLVESKIMAQSLADRQKVEYKIIFEILTENLLINEN